MELFTFDIAHITTNVGFSRMEEASKMQNIITDKRGEVIHYLICRLLKFHFYMIFLFFIDDASVDFANDIG
jgi:hypothetical protein